ncbi:preprotein translocase subunit SecE [Leptospira wolffii]|uniref:Protein translocase subunit SecE n=1 Tax=Leptospira wolffii TaxID=409998 RepID=A0A2M9ZG72_9LEPT|nr:preprotein translocase subunit SecE [Leptospira wolffii]EPG64208.1 preprotein translocase, SecE subunit [Leptospira wolffii serovar Khorat str. Khorat-H2]PJZ67430.1 preprotein translocase subunit SecE [Leptospira wolffii]TGK62433.1 preprotein translocase subunit SecE [Leptospira wolffii]TGK65976.1 preprotein translocase subunit SecE [Leptospira wolffii]TGK74183.1 preprotein translocase subunit SecE [Leptospira wolffii]
MKLGTFIQECREELKKVQWPNRQEVVQSTFVVLGTVLFFSAFLFLSDTAFVKLLTGFWNL